MQKNKINKNISIISFLLLLVFIISLLMCYVNFCDTSYINSLNYQNHIDNINKQNAAYRICCPNIISGEKEEPLFTDSETAILTALKAIETNDKYVLTSNL